MAKNKLGKRKKRKLLRFVVSLIVAVLAFWGYNEFDIGNKLNLIDRDKEVTDSIEVHIIDVGQGDAILIRTPSGNMLIDAGTNSSESKLKTYLSSYGIKSFEYAVFTHPHADHIGGADMIIRDFEVENVLMPDVTTNTVTYNAMISELEKSTSNVQKAVVGNQFSIGDLDVTVVAPSSDEYSEMNDYSIMLRVKYGKKVFMFTGDAEVLSENEVLNKFHADFLDCDFLKLGHHGSITSSGENFLDVLSPDIAAISVGEGNDYDHPSNEVIKRLKDAGITYYRTDISGTLVFECDGENIIFKD